MRASQARAQEVEQIVSAEEDGTAFAQGGARHVGVAQLAQIAALGTTVALILGIHPEQSLSYLFSLGFVVLGAGLFSVTRVREQRIPQEAVIGITYAVATAAALLAYALVMNEQMEWAKLLIDNYEDNQISELAAAKIQLAEGQRELAA